LKKEIVDLKYLEECKRLFRQLNFAMMAGFDMEGGEGDRIRRDIRNISKRLSPKDLPEARRHEEEMSRRKLALRQNIHNYIMKKVGEGDRDAALLIKEFYFK